LPLTGPVTFTGGFVVPDTFALLADFAGLAGAAVVCWSFDVTGVGGFVTDAEGFVTTGAKGFAACAGGFVVMTLLEL